jgi:hypothetical protein
MIRIGKGARFTRVAGINDFYWELITRCWHQAPEQRPSFAEILEILRKNRTEYAFPGTDLAALEKYENEVLAEDEEFLKWEAATVPEIIVGLPPPSKGARWLQRRLS